ncbi:MAG: C10 family peptidase [Muribaculaceae bacterium]|nr:C10 family peptidase [Muribaculaceae bacterium]
MKKTIKLGIHALGILLLSGCSNDCEDGLVNEPEVMNQDAVYEFTVPDTIKEVTDAKAMDVARMFMASNSDSRATVRAVESVNTIYGDDGTPQMYVVNYAANQGYVIASASKDYYPVIAYSDEGHYDMELGNKLYSNSLLKEHLPIMAKAKELPQDVKLAIASRWTSYNSERRTVRASDESRANAADYEDYGRPKAYYDSISKWNSQGLEMYTWADYQQTSEYQALSDDEKQEMLLRIREFGNGSYGFGYNSIIVLRRGYGVVNKTQLMKTKWAQDVGFNKYTGGYLLGCSTVAAGQVMRYHEYPSDIDWSAMDNLAANDVSALFLHNLREHIGYVIKNQDQSISTISQVKSALDSYGYSTYIQNHNTSEVDKNLSKQCPVIMCGIETGKEYGHMWVCDGVYNGYWRTEIQIMTLDYTGTTIPNEMYQCWSKRVSESRIDSYHMNWGEGGGNNGYYRDADLSAINGNSSRPETSQRYDLYVSK